MAIVDIVGAAASGGLFGVLGTVAGRVANYFEKKQANQHQISMWQHEKEMHRLQMEARAAETEQEIDLAATQGSWSGLEASINAEGRIGKSYKWVDAVRALTRPTLTILLWFIAASIWLTTADEGLRGRIVETVTFAATAATLWWFGDRAQKRDNDG